MVRPVTSVRAAPARIKEESFLWMGCWAVWVPLLQVKQELTGGNTCTTVRRKRGLRKGKRRPLGRRLPYVVRARGGKPRSLTADRPPLPSGVGPHRDVMRPTVRQINRACRNLDYWWAKLDALGNSVKQAPKEGWFDDRGKPSPRMLWLQFALSRLNRGLMSHGAELRPYVVDSASYFLEKLSRVVFPGSYSSQEVLRDILGEVRLSATDALRETARGARQDAFVNFYRRNFVGFEANPLGSGELQRLNQVGSSESALRYLGTVEHLPIYPEQTQMGRPRYLCRCFLYLLTRGMQCPACKRFENGDPHRLVSGDPRPSPEGSEPRGRRRGRRGRAR